MSTSRRKFISAATVAAVAHPCVRAEEKLFSIGLIADAQYVDAKPAGIRHYRNSIQKLRNAVNSINKSQVDFSIHLGDLIDREFKSFDAILAPLSKLESPVYQILGNHDFDVADEQKENVMGKMSMKTSYSSFSKNGFRFVFLDGTEISTFAQPKDSQEHAAAMQVLKEMKDQGRKNAKPWNAAIGPQQLDWLREQLKGAATASEKVILSCHYPILPDNSHNLWNDREVLSLLDEFPGTVAAWFNGHNHAGNYAERNGVHFVTVQGMVDTPNQNAFGVMDVFPGTLKIRGSGRVPDRILEIAH
ncbi:MAG: metallophosphoesterase [Verrucomicrobiales bacterium]|nr:metallophosphoesterase [Verrucomicrobiales bacterium]